MKPIDRQQAIKLITLVIDGEANSEQEKAFMNYLREDDEVRRAYESQLNIKRIVQERLDRKKAPPELRSRVRLFLNSLQTENPFSENINIDFGDTLISDFGKSDPTESIKIKESTATTSAAKPQLRYVYRAIVAAAAILVISVLTLEFLDRFSPVSDASHNVGELAFTHFTNQISDLQTAGWQPASIDEAQQHLNSEYGMDIHMPEIQGATLSAISYSDFAADFKTPVLQYFQPDLDEYIIVFAFKVDSLENFNALERDPEAVKKCKTYDDFHIRVVQNKHVVSWKWDDNWYAAISNHNGHELATIIRPANE